MSITHGYKNQEPYAILMHGRPEESASHRAIAVYSKDEYETFRKQGWKPQREFTAMARRAQTDPKGYWDD